MDTTIQGRNNLRDMSQSVSKRLVSVTISSDRRDKSGLWWLLKNPWLISLLPLPEPDLLDRGGVSYGRERADPYSARTQ